MNHVSLEFWSSLPSGWPFQITEGGWHRFEAKRRGCTSQFNSYAKEYLFTGCDDCVNVISTDAPKFLYWIED